MQDFHYVFGPVPSRRLGRSLGISPIPPKTCNYSCIYCQLGRTNHMTNTRKDFFPLEDILKEVDIALKNLNYDVISIVGEGEPTLYKKLGTLIREVQKRTDKPVVVITNGALFYDEEVRKEVAYADIVMPSLDASNEKVYKRVDRPYGKLDFQQVYQGLVAFCREYTGQVFMEIMLMKDINDDEASLQEFKRLLQNLNYDKLYLNTPVRPPVELSAVPVEKETMCKASEILGGICIDSLASGSFYSDIEDNYEAVKSIIARHPMNQFEITGFIESRNADAVSILKRLSRDEKIKMTEFKGYTTYRFI